MSRVSLLVKKDLREVSRTPASLAVMTVLPLLFVAVIPAIGLLFLIHVVPADELEKARDALEQLPLPVDVLEGTAIATVLPEIAARYLFAPILLLVPAMVTNIIASQSFVGEKERGTIETLLYTPLTSRDLVLGKTIAALVPGLITSAAAHFIYFIIVNIILVSAGLPMALMDLGWLLFVVLLTPAIAYLSVICVVAISHRSKSAQSAQSVGGFLVLPVVAGVISQAVGFFVLDYKAILILSFITLALCALLTWLASRTFRPERIAFIT
ncbi:MAG: ABC transporter permease subunit [Corynebacterium sp.]|nr:ABC transporter permease subunit [Corynebacterium sp.]